VLAPLGWIYCAVAVLRRRAYGVGLLKSHRAGVPVVVIGNLSVGGTGKTPLVLRLAELALERGWRPAILTRGYGGRGGPWPVNVSATDDPGRVGDEPVMLARRGVCPVVAGPDRVADARLAVVEHGANLLLCDDGLQHYRLARDLEVAVIDAARELGNRRCLPAGPLREPPGRLRAVDLVVRNGGAGQGHRFRLVAGEAVSLGAPALTRPLEHFRGVRVTAVAGIGNPERFFADLRRRGLEVEARPYPDHHVLTAADVASWPPGPVLMTEKDAVKCVTFAGAEGGVQAGADASSRARSEARSDLWACPVRAEPDAAFVSELFARLPPIPTSKV
jgi:tetraacyldisaccharide 4'-kinase